MKYVKTDSLNRIITENPRKLVNDSEGNYYCQLNNVCGEISKKRNTHPVISLDNYFRSNTSPDMPRDKNGNIDLESPLCTDLKLLQEHLVLMNEGKEFMMPVFDFKKQSRSSYVPFKREADSLVIIEGIHALNPLVTGENNFATCIYISVRTRLKDRNNKILHPRIIRLIRRLCRDSASGVGPMAATLAIIDK